MKKILNKISTNPFIHKILYKSYTFESVSGETKTIEKKRSKIPLICVILLTITGLCFIFIDLPKRPNIGEFFVILGKLFVPNPYATKDANGYFNYMFTIAMPELWYTIEMCFLATVFGSILSIPLFIQASRNIVLKKRIYLPVRIILNIIRTIPTFVLAVIATVFFGYSRTAGICAMTFFTLGIMFKLMYEHIETSPMNAFEASLSSGATRLQAFRTTMWPQVKPMFYSDVLYTFEINIRASVVLGFVSAGGIGSLISQQIDNTFYDRVGAILIPLFVVVVALQLTSNYVRRKTM